MYTVEDIDLAVEETGWLDDEGRIRTGWDNLLWSGRYDPVELPGIGAARTIHDGTDNGETAANGYYFVFTITDADGNVRTFKRDGWYASHEGGELDGPTYEVQAVQRLVTFWEGTE